MYMTNSTADDWPKVLSLRTVVRVHLFELLGSSERKWGVAGVWKIYPVELQDRARLHFPYTTYYHVESVLQKRLKRQDYPLLIVSISIYNSGDEDLLTKQSLNGMSPLTRLFD